jgi:hypothetical protein
VVLLTYLLPPVEIYGNLWRGELTRNQFVFITAATIAFTLEFTLARHLFCRFGCAVGLFQSLVWMANRRAMVVGFDAAPRPRLRQLQRACDNACPMRLKPRSIKRKMFTCTQCASCVSACDRGAGRRQPRGLPAALGTGRLRRWRSPIARRGMAASCRPARGDTILKTIRAGGGATVAAHGRKGRRTLAPHGDPHGPYRPSGGGPWTLPSGTAYRRGAVPRLGGDGGLRVEAANPFSTQRPAQLAQAPGGHRRPGGAGHPRRPGAAPAAQYPAVPDPALNRDLYLWLAALAAQGSPDAYDWFRASQRMSRAVLERYPGMASRYERLVEAYLATRIPPERLPADEAAQEQALRAALQAPGTVEACRRRAAACNRCTCGCSPRPR